MKKLKSLWAKRPRFLKIVNTALYFGLFAFAVFYLAEMRRLGEPASDQFIISTYDAIKWALGITGGIKGVEAVTDAATAVASIKHSTETTPEGCADDPQDPE